MAEDRPEGQSKRYYFQMFLLSGSILILAGIIFYQLQCQIASNLLLSLGTTAIAVVLVTILWEHSGGEPFIKKLDNLEKSNEIISDSIATGVYRIFHNRMVLFNEKTYSIINSEISNAKEVFILSLVFNVTQSKELQKNILNCIKNDGVVRILISAPEITEKGESKKPLPLELRQHAEKDDTGKMKAEIRYTIKYLEDIKKGIQNDTPNNAQNFQYKLLSTHVMYCSIIGIDQKMYLTNYLNKYQGLSSPTMIIEKTNDKRSLYEVYKEQFEYLWKKADGYAICEGEVIFQSMS